MLVDPEVEPAVTPSPVEPRFAVYYEDCRRFHAPPVASGALAGNQGAVQPMSKASPAPLELAGHRRDHSLVREKVPLAGEVLADEVSGPVAALRASPGGRVSVPVDDPELSMRPARVAPSEPPDDLGGA